MSGAVQHIQLLINALTGEVKFYFKWTVIRLLRVNKLQVKMRW
jgi:hypothetical protein